MFWFTLTFLPVDQISIFCFVEIQAQVNLNSFRYSKTFLLLKKEIWMHSPNLVNFAKENERMTLVLGINSTSFRFQNTFQKVAQWWVYLASLLKNPQLMLISVNWAYVVVVALVRTLFPSQLILKWRKRFIRITDLLANQSECKILNDVIALADISSKCKRTRVRLNGWEGQISKRRTNLGDLLHY